MLRRLRAYFGAAKSSSVWAMAGGIPRGAQPVSLPPSAQIAMKPSHRSLCSSGQLCSGCKTKDPAAELDARLKYRLQISSHMEDPECTVMDIEGWSVLLQEAPCVQPAQGIDLMHAPVQEVCRSRSLDSTARAS